MKKIILSLILILSFAFANAQKTDTIYVADSSVYIRDIVTGESDRTVANHAEFIFRNNASMEIYRDSLKKVFVVDDISDQQFGEDYIITVYEGHIDKDMITLAITIYKNRLWAIGIFRSNDGVVFYIKGKDDVANDARALRWLGRGDTPRLRSGTYNYNTELPR